MSAWFLCCAVSGLGLGLRSSMHIMLAFAAVILPAGVVYQLESGFGAALLTAIGGVVLLQICYMFSALAVAFLSQARAPAAIPLPTRSKH